MNWKYLHIGPRGPGSSSRPQKDPDERRASHFSYIPLPRLIVDPDGGAFTTEHNWGWRGATLLRREPELRDCRGSFMLLTMMRPFAKRWNVD